MGTLKTTTVTDKIEQIQVCVMTGVRLVMLLTDSVSCMSKTWLLQFSDTINMIYMWTLQDATTDSALPFSVVLLSVTDQIYRSQVASVSNTKVVARTLNTCIWSCWNTTWIMIVSHPLYHHFMVVPMVLAFAWTCIMYSAASEVFDAFSDLIRSYFRTHHFGEVFQTLRGCNVAWGP